jgi:hypothetical protein
MISAGQLASTVEFLIWTDVPNLENKKSRHSPAFSKRICDLIKGPCGKVDRPVARAREGFSPGA